MYQFVNIFGQEIFLRDLLVNMGSAISIMVVLILYICSFKKHKKTDESLSNGVKKKMFDPFFYIVLPILIEIVIVFTVGTAVALVIRRFCFPFDVNQSQDFLEMWKNGGTHFIGMVMASCILLPIIFEKMYRESATRMLDIIAFFFPIQHIFNRLGCFAEGCCYGIPMEGHLSVKFPDDILPYRVFPSQLFEALCMVVLLVVMIILCCKKIHIFYPTMIGFGISILISECFMDKRGTVMYAGFTVIQIAAWLLILIAGCGWFIKGRKGKTLLLLLGLFALGIQAVGSADYLGNSTNDSITAAKLPTEETDEGISQSWYIEDLDCQNVWSEIESKGKLPGEGVVIAVIDTGLSSAATALKDARWCNEAELNGDEGVDDDNNGYVDDVYGLNIANSYAYQTDNVGHGTEIAGLIAMQPGDGGGTGVAYGAKIMPIKVSQDTNYDEDSIIEALEYAVSMGADIINMSFACYSPSEKLEEAVREASKSCVLVAAAGNEGYATTGELSAEELKKMGYSCKDAYPAAWDCCIGVMASDVGGQLTSFTNWDQSTGENVKYNIVAPGQNLYTYTKGNRYTTVKGTSYSTALVSAAVAVYMGINGKDATPQQITIDFLSLMKQSTRFSCGGEYYYYPKLLLTDLLDAYENGEQSGGEIGKEDGEGSDEKSGDVEKEDGKEIDEKSGDVEKEDGKEIDEKSGDIGKDDGKESDEKSGDIEKENGKETDTLGESGKDTQPLTTKTTEALEQQPTVKESEKNVSIRFGKVTQNKNKLTVIIKQIPDKGKVTLKLSQTYKKNGKKKVRSCNFSIKGNKATLSKRKLAKNKICKGKAVFTLQWKNGKKKITKKKTIRINMNI